MYCHTHRPHNCIKGVVLSSVHSTARSFNQCSVRNFDIMSEQKSVDEVEATIRTNEFTLQMSGLSNLKFEDSDHSITSGQPWHGISKIKCNDSGCTMYVNAGRKNSAAPADWFARAVEPGSAIGCTTTDTMPKKLNFAFKGNMSFDHRGQTFTGEDIVIGQGSTDSFRNNWWIGGQNMSVIASAPPFASSEAQTFNVNAFPFKAKVTFSATIADVSTVHVGVITLNE